MANLSRSDNSLNLLLFAIPNARDFELSTLDPSMKTSIVVGAQFGFGPGVALQTGKIVHAISIWSTLIVSSAREGCGAAGAYDWRDALLRRFEGDYRHARS